MDGQLFGIHIGHSSAFLAFFDADKPSNIVFDRIRLFALWSELVVTSLIFPAHGEQLSREMCWLSPGKKVVGDTFTYIL